MLRVVAEADKGRHTTEILTAHWLTVGDTVASMGTHTDTAVVLVEVDEEEIWRVEGVEKCTVLESDTRTRIRL